MPPVSLLSQQLKEVHWLKICRVNTVCWQLHPMKGWIILAYRQKELTHYMCVDFKPAAGIKSTQRPGRRGGKISSYRCSVAFMNESFLRQLKKTKILGYKDTLFRV